MSATVVNLALLPVLLAAIPCVHFSISLWSEGMLGGAGAGLLALPAAGGLAYVSRSRPMPAPAWPPWLGSMFSAVGALGYAAGVALARTEPAGWLIAGAALPLLALAWLLEARGASVAARALFPLGFCLFALPWELVLRELDAPLQIISAQLGVGILTMLGHELQWWNEYTFWNDSYYLVINETCSGMNMLMTLLMYGLVFGWLTLRTLPQRALLLLAVPPLALAANGLRVAVIWLMGHHGGDALAMGFWHTGSAYLIFLPVFWLMYVWARMLQRLGSRRPPLEIPELAR